MTAPTLSELRSLRVALVHDWLVTLRGGERVLDAFCELFPNATVYTLVRREGVATPRIEAMTHAPSFADRFPGSHSHHRWLLPLYPSAIERLPVGDCDLILSSSHCVAKAVIPGPGAVHVCYSHTPVRYAWDRTDDYLKGTNAALSFASPLLGLAAKWLRGYDLSTLGRVDAFLANSKNTASKIEKFYGRDAAVVVPPVETDRFSHYERAPAGYDLVLSGLVPYKRVDLAVLAYAHLPDRRLVVVGDGPELERLRRLAPPNVQLRGRVPESELADCYRGAELLVFPGEEDFGIVPLEAQAAGIPVVAFGQGGALESVIDGETGLYFHEQTPQAVADAIVQMTEMGIDPAACRKNAARFRRSVFLENMVREIASAMANSPARGRSARLGSEALSSQAGHA
ncbi:MAG: glycosyltransferase [Myxococcales bacterium]|nr:glycosyltransferase [Myxococcales bacterium]